MCESLVCMPRHRLETKIRMDIWDIRVQTGLRWLRTTSSDRILMNSLTNLRLL
jgi:hypothetical protein